jgi:hypothetical protein
LAERDLFKSTGVATLRVKFSGFSTDSVKAGNIERLRVNLSEMTGKDLKSQIAQQISVDEHRLKLICLGRVLNENLILEQQNVKNGVQIMVLVVSGDQDALKVIVYLCNICYVSIICCGILVCMCWFACIPISFNSRNCIQIKTKC